MQCLLWVFALPVSGRVWFTFLTQLIHSLIGVHLYRFGMVVVGGGVPIVTGV